MLNFTLTNFLFHSVANIDLMPFNHPFFMLLNIAIGEGFGGKIDLIFLSDTMEIDYISVFKTKY